MLHEEGVGTLSAAGFGLVFLEGVGLLPPPVQFHPPSGSPPASLASGALWNYSSSVISMEDLGPHRVEA